MAILDHTHTQKRNEKKTRKKNRRKFQVHVNMILTL